MGRLANEAVERKQKEDAQKAKDKEIARLAAEEQAALDEAKRNFIAPTVGRSILYNHPDFEELVPAMIATVFSEDCITIGGFDGNGIAFNAQEINISMNDIIPEGEAGWMPYQKAQKAK